MQLLPILTFLLIQYIFNLLEAQVARLTDRANLLTNFLWSRKRAVENVTLQKKAMSLEKELREREIKKGSGGCIYKSKSNCSCKMTHLLL